MIMKPSLNEPTTCCTADIQINVSQMDPSFPSGGRPLFNEHDDDDDDNGYSYSGGVKDSLRVLLVAPDRPLDIPPKAGWGWGAGVGDTLASADTDANVSGDARRPPPVLTGGRGAGDSSVDRCWNVFGRRFEAAGRNDFPGKERRSSGTEVGRFEWIRTYGDISSWERRKFGKGGLSSW